VPLGTLALLAAASLVISTPSAIAVHDPGDYLATADAIVSWKAHFDSANDVADSTDEPCETSTLRIVN
jgi:hypothetical protein